MIIYLLYSWSKSCDHDKNWRLHKLFFCLESTVNLNGRLNVILHIERSTLSSSQIWNWRWDSSLWQQRHVNLDAKLENVQRNGRRMWLVIKRMYCHIQKLSFNSIKLMQSLHGPIKSLRGSGSDKVVCQLSTPATLNLLLSEA